MKVGILGCTGLVGQKYVSLLRSHPFFEIGFLSASDKNVGKQIDGIPIQPLEHIEKDTCELYFSALPSKIAYTLEMRLARKGKWVISSSSAFRNIQDVPVIIPEINGAHLSLIEDQRMRLNTTSGGIVAKPNCTLQSFLLPLYPLHEAFELSSVVVTNLQAVSGGGKRATSDLLDNLFPYIPNEEEKSESEPLKILGDMSIRFSAHCVRVPILHGHTSLVNATFKKEVNVNECIDLWEHFHGLALPSAPKRPVQYTTDVTRPQPKLDRDREGGMAVSVGRLRACSVHDIKFVALSHNLLRGAAGGGVLLAELIAEKECWYGREKSAIHQTV